MISLDKERCTACGACNNICPNDSIYMKPDNEGFLYPKVDMSKCLNCGLCVKSCPVINKLDSNNSLNPKAYAAWSLDKDVRENSTSGGMFTELAKSVISQGGYVVGARYNVNHLVEHSVIDEEDNISILRQSKYVQSNVGLVYRLIKEHLNKKKFVMVIGTPCQCAGLLGFLNKPYENLILCDFICRGVNSPKAYLKYLESLKRKYNTDIKKVWFKNKINGWNKFCTKIEFEDGQEYYKDRYNDLFMVGYLKYNLYIRRSCSNCNFKGFPRYSDITLADFWGVKLKDKSQDTDKGTSLVILNSEKGQRYFERISSQIFKEESSLEEALPFNQCAVKSVNQGEKRELFFSEIDRLDFEDIMNKIMTGQ